MNAKNEKVIIYHNARCRKSRCALALLKEKKVNTEVIDYLKNPPGAAELNKLLARLHLKPLDIIRKEEPIFKQKFRGLQLNDHEWLEIMIAHPILIQRPIVVKGNKAIIARPAELINELL